jgi:antitoxin ParD1/3/4
MDADRSKSFPILMRRPYDDAPHGAVDGPIAFGTIFLTLCGEDVEDDAMATLTVSLPDSMKGWIEDQVGEGGYASAGDYLSDLIRQDQERLEELRRIVDEGLASGVSTRTTAEIFAEAIEITKARGTYRE